MNPPPFTHRWLYIAMPMFIGFGLALFAGSFEAFGNSWFWLGAAAITVVASVSIFLIDTLLKRAPAFAPEGLLVSAPLLTERLPNGKRKLKRELAINFDGKQIVVPEDTETDFSTIPFFGRFVVRWSQVDIAGVVHDWLYRVGEVNGEPITRKFADRVWYACARSGDSRANPLQARVCWLSLRWGASGIWEEARKKSHPC